MYSMMVYEPYCWLEWLLFPVVDDTSLGKQAGVQPEFNDGGGRHVNFFRFFLAEGGIYVNFLKLFDHFKSIFEAIFCCAEDERKKLGF